MGVARLPGLRTTGDDSKRTGIEREGSGSGCSWKLQIAPT